MRLILAVAASLAVLWTAAQVLLSWRRPELGLRDGSLRTCGPRPNCVCSRANEAPHAISPLEFDGDARDAFQRLKQLVAARPGTELIAETDNYLRFECTTPLMRFVDDLEFALDEAQPVIQVRSASRVGYSDMGTNRKRVEEIRRQLAATEASENGSDAPTR